MAHDADGCARGAQAGRRAGWGAEGLRAREASLAGRCGTGGGRERGTRARARAQARAGARAALRAAPWARGGGQHAVASGAVGRSRSRCRAA